MNTPKKKITVNAQVDNFKQAKELLADLEVLNEKYDVHFCIEKNNHSLLFDDFSPEDTAA